MIVLDTNVLSEAMRQQPSSQVMAWLSAQPAQSLFTSTITRSEILYGIALLPEGKRRNSLHEVATAIFTEDFAGRVLFFDNSAADAYAGIAAKRHQIGHPISQFGAMVAPIAYSRGAQVATRNTKDFKACGVTLIDPWTKPSTPE